MKEFIIKNQVEILAAIGWTGWMACEILTRMNKIKANVVTQAISNGFKALALKNAARIEEKKSDAPPPAA
jgi:hypothetical protein